MEAGIPGESGVHVTLIYIRRDLDVVTGPLQSTEEPLVAEMVKRVNRVQVCTLYKLFFTLIILFVQSLAIINIKLVKNTLVFK